MRRLLEGMSFNGDGSDSQTGQNDTGLFFMWNLYRDLSDKRYIISIRETRETPGWQISRTESIK